jgi:hypothetical protein
VVNAQAVWRNQTTYRKEMLLMALELAYYHNKEGKQLDGSIDTLIEGILEGRRVRIIIKDETTADAYFASDLVTLKVIS